MTTTTTAVAEVLQHEIDTALQQAAKQREDLQQRVVAMCDRIQRRQVLARAEALAPSFRAEILRRAKAIQKSRDGLLQMLRRFAGALHTSNLTRDVCGPPNVVVVLRAVRDALRAEEALSHWCQSLPRKETWRAVCAAVRDGGGRGGVSAQLPEEEEEDVGAEGRLGAALARVLLPSGGGRAEEDEGEAAAPRDAWIAIPCFCTVAHYCCHAELSVAAAAAKGPNVHGGKREKLTETPHDATAEAEGDVSGDNAVTRALFHTAAAHFRLLSRQVDEEDGEGGVDGDDNWEEALEEARLRVSIEVAARATACRSAVETLATGDEGVLFDGVATVTAGVPIAAPVTTLVLPSLEQLFFCIAYTIGAAILRDEQNERGVTFSTTTAPITVDDDNSREGGWKGALELWILQERSDANTASAFVGPRLLQYLLEYVFCPTPHDNSSEEASALVDLETAQRWLERVCVDTPDKDSVIAAMMTSYSKRR